MAQSSELIAEPFSTRLADSKRFYRFFEILPGAISWFFLLSPFFLSLFAPSIVAYFIIAFDLFWLLKSLRMSFGLLRGYSNLRRDEKVDWAKRLGYLDDIDGSLAEIEQKLTKRLSRDSLARTRLINELRSLQVLSTQENVLLKPSQIWQVVMMPMYKETIDTVGPSIEAVLACNYDMKKVIFVLAYEQRGGEADLVVAQELEKRYSKRFGKFFAIEHPSNIEGELKGKGANITFAGRQLLEYVEEQKIPLIDVIVTTLDADNRPHKHYFNYLSYLYCTDPNRRHKSFQPIPMFLNNIWDVPAPTRIVATSNSFWVIIEATRPHRLRNFSSHAQSLQTLVDTDFWSVTTIVEDGHQFWRTFFTYDGDHSVVPIYLPIYQDAVLASSFTRTLKSQFLQMRRWAYGVSDFPYIVTNCVKNQKIALSTKIVQIWRHFEGNFSWATAPLLLLYVAWLPLYLNHDFREQVLAHQLPVVASRILTLAMLGLIITVWISLASLPPRPSRYRKGKYILMLTQWVLAPVVAIFFGAFAAINAQTRLMLGRRLEVFQVTEKTVKK